MSDVVKIEEVVAKKPGRPKKTTAAPKRIDITIDTGAEDVVKLNNEGCDLFFNEEVGRFKELPEDIFRALRIDNKNRYAVSKVLNDSAKKAATRSPLSDRVKVSGRLASATARLEVEGKDPNKHYAWKRTDEEMDWERAGFKVAEGDNLRTLVSSPSGVHRVGMHGQDELILVETSNENADAIERQVVQRSKQRASSVEDEAAEAMARNYGVPYRFEKGERDPHGAKFSAPKIVKRGSAE